MAQNFTVPVGLYAAASNPTVPTPAAGDIYYNTTSSEMRFYNGSTWVAVGGGGAAAAGTLTGTTLASNVVNSSLTSFGSSPTIDTPILTLSATTSNSIGRIAWDNTNSQIEIGNGSSIKVFTADDAAATLTNKTISGSSNTVSTTGTLTIGTGLSGTSFNGSSNVTIAIDSTVATLTGTQTLTNKTLTTTGTITANAGGGWSGSNFGKQLLITTPSNQSNPAIALTDAVGGNLWGIANASGTFYLATGPAYSDSTTAPTVRFAISSTGKIGLGTTSFPADPYCVNIGGALQVTQATDITPGASGSGQITIGGNGYSGFLSLDATTMWVGHNSGARTLTLATDETARLTISEVGAVNIPGTLSVASVPVVTTTATQTLTNKTITDSNIRQPSVTATIPGASYTLQSSDAGYLVLINVGSAVTVSIPASTFAVGTTITLLQQGTGQVTVQASNAGVTNVFSGGATTAAPKTRARYSAITIVQTSSENWYAMGDLS